MARMQAFVDRATLPERAHASHDEILATRKYILGPIAWVLPHTPQVAVRMAALGDAVRKTEVLGKAHLQIVACLAAHALKNDYLWQAHVRSARKAGVTEETLAAIQSEGPLDSLAPDAALIVQYGRDMCGAREIDSEIFASLHTRFGDTGMMELATVYGYYLAMAAVAKTAGIEPDGAGGGGG